MVEHVVNEDEKQEISLNAVNPCYYVGKSKVSFQNKYSSIVLEELKEQLHACRQLLDLEPDNKWTLLTTAFFLYCVNAKAYYKEIMGILETLINIDKQRSGYYNDLKTKWSIEENIRENYDNPALEYKVEYKLCSLPHLQFYSFCRTVDLSNQKLTSRVLPTLIKLQHCKNLNLSNNKLTSLQGFPDIPLEELNIKNNDISVNDVEQLRIKLKNTNIIF